MTATDQSPAVVCLRPRRDFEQMGIEVPDDLEVTFFDSERDLDRIGPEVACVVLPSAGPALSPEMFTDARGLSIVQYTGAGIDRIGDDVINALGCAVCNVPGASAPDVASYVAVATGVLLRNVIEGDRLMKAGMFSEARSRMTPALVRGYRGLCVGVVGFGSIGFEVAQTFHALGAEVLWYDPQPAAADASGLFERVGLDELLERSEVLTVHVPLLESTRGLIDAAALARLQPGALVVNAARGGIIEEAALMDALDSSHLGGVVLDVFQDEPLPASSPLVAWAQRHVERVLLTPHIAGVTPEASRVLFVQAWSNVRAVLVEGSEPRHRLR
ncbi:MAG: 3-phosphoglycerate dehydrogenase [Acidimicrobiaceae bacterium]|nr:3-phosphoglycerate dehydrogenase [Acidimicrobiaceae bacterium]